MLTLSTYFLLYRWLCFSKQSHRKSQFCCLVITEKHFLTPARSFLNCQHVYHLWITRKSCCPPCRRELSNGCCWIKSTFVLLFRWNGRRDGSCLPKRAWRGRRLSISAPRIGTKLSCRLPIRNWRVCFWQPNKLVIISSTWNPPSLACTDFHAFVLNR